MGCCGGIDKSKQKKENQTKSGVATTAAPPNPYTVDLTATDNVNMQRAMELQMKKYHKRYLNG